MKSFPYRNDSIAMKSYTLLTSAQLHHIAVDQICPPTVLSECGFCSTASCFECGTDSYPRVKFKSRQFIPMGNMVAAQGSQ